MPAPARRRKKESASSGKDEWFAGLRSVRVEEGIEVRKRMQLQTGVADGLLL
jgi:hypothetical protein